MESALDKISEHCATHLHSLSSCIDANPTDWSIKCQREKQSLSLCSEEHSNEIKEAKKRCSNEITEFEKCVKANVGGRSDGGDVCGYALRKLYECTNGA